MERAWSEVSGPQKPCIPRLERDLAASGPVAWPLKSPLYQTLAEEGGWDDPIVAGLYGSCVDIYGSIDSEAALGILRRLRQPTKDDVVQTRAGRLGIAMAFRGRLGSPRTWCCCGFRALWSGFAPSYEV